ncbi:hypothetical protein [Bradyrhizobium sp. DOA9]|uniref:hypothetical protein n=1 Tax=Bradyrhizobium sp. DOA9 TaxID=1126627 RepID=UPI0012602C47|nr:hypothetical protein [Bradyrhizobium sp. DOA9]
MARQTIKRRHVTERGTVEVDNAEDKRRDANFEVKFAARFQRKPDVTVSVTRVQLDRDGEHPVSARVAVVEATAEKLIGRLETTQDPSAGLVNSATFEYSASGDIE